MIIFTMFSAFESLSALTANWAMGSLILSTSLVKFSYCILNQVVHDSSSMLLLAAESCPQRWVNSFIELIQVHPKFNKYDIEHFPMILAWKQYH
jgi:hypothetical protein